MACATATCTSTKHRSLGVVANGGFADRLIVPHAKYLFDHGEVPGALACTYACSGLTAFSAIRKAAKTGAGHIVTIGAGGVGLAGLAIARNVTDATITVCDIDDAKLEAATAMGADHVVNSGAADAANWPAPARSPPCRSKGARSARPRRRWTT